MVMDVTSRNTECSSHSTNDNKGADTTNRRLGSGSNLGSLTQAVFLLVFDILILAERVYDQRDQIHHKDVHKQIHFGRGSSSLQRSVLIEQTREPKTMQKLHTSQCSCQE